MSTYIPNIADPRVQKRVIQAYGFTSGCLSTHEPRRWSKVVLAKHFGQKGELTELLRACLLIVTDEHYSMDDGVTKEYLANKAGLEVVRNWLQGNVTGTEVMKTIHENSNTIHTLVCRKSEPIISDDKAVAFDNKIVTEWARREYGADLGKLTFEYKDRSNRLWHPLQWVRREVKKKLLEEAGLIHHYDIQACAPTLIHQHAQHLGMDEYLFALRGYIKDRTTLRNRLADETGYEVKKIKVLINSLFCGARLSVNERASIFKVFDYDAKVIRQFQKDLELNSLRGDIKKCWQYIEPTMTKVVNAKGRKLALSPKHKWNRYFQLERSVTDVFRKYLEQTQNKCFLEHDGFSSEKPVDTALLQAQIKEATGFDVVLEKS